MEPLKNNPLIHAFLRKLTSDTPKPASVRGKTHFPFRYLLLLLVIVASVPAGCTDDYLLLTEPWGTEILRLRTAVAPYHDIRVAKEAGYDTDITGYRTQMGYHYLNGSLLDDQFEVEKPEALLYAHDAAGNLQLVAVEYATPIADMNNPPPAPEGFTGNEDVWEINTEFNVWTLHAWIVMDNPNGIFTALNPKLP